MPPLISLGKEMDDRVKSFEQAKLNLERGQIDQALFDFTKLLNGKFGDHEALFYTGTCFLAKGHYGLAAALYRQAIDLHPDFPDALLNLGACFKSTNDFVSAEQMFRLAESVAENPRDKSALWANIAALHSENGEPETALTYYEKALEIWPENKIAKYNTCFSLMNKGDWAEGFKRYHYGFEIGQRTTRTYPDVREWKGEDLTGKTVIVWGDQGLGDEIMAASCLPDLVKEAKKVIFDCHPRLQKLFERSFDIECYGTRKTQRVEWAYDQKVDFSIPITALFMRYRSEGQFPGTPFIKAAQAPHQGRLKVGLAWAGGTNNTRQGNRSMTLETLSPLLDLPCDFFSLHYRPEAADDCARYEEKTGIHIKHYPGKVQCTDYAETADFVSSMDLVISVCTSVIHLAGSMGKECWVMTPNTPAWRYGTEGSKMALYNSVKLYRQQAGDTWAPVISEIRHDLANRLMRKEAAE